MGVDQDVKLGATQIENWGGEGVEVEANDVGAFVGDGEGVPCGACENPSGVVDWGEIGEGVVILERNGVGGGGEGEAVVAGEVAGEGAVVDEGGGGGGAAVDEVVVGGREEVGEGGEREKEKNEEESGRHGCER